MEQYINNAPFALVIVFLIIGFVFLIKGADFFVEGSSSIAKKLKVPSIIIGLTIVAMGTSLPETAVSVTASLVHNNELAVSNVVGSNIFNLMFVIGVCAIMTPIMVQKDTIARDIPLSVICALLLLGLLVAPHISRVITIPKNVMIPVVTSLCVIGSFSCNNRLFDVALMFLFGLIGFLMRRFDYPVAPLILAMVLGQMMDSNFRQAVSLASSSDHPLLSTFGHWQTILLLLCVAWILLGNIPWTKPYMEKLTGILKKKTA